jgi:uncharacterized protein YggT (Ycf19 family)
VESLLHFFASFVAILLNVVSFAMMIRMLLPLFINAEESRLYLFLAYITEPFIAPVRFLMAKFNILQDSPIDWSFTVSYLVIVLLQFMLPAV